LIRSYWRSETACSLCFPKKSHEILTSRLHSRGRENFKPANLLIHKSVCSAYAPRTRYCSGPYVSIIVYYQNYFVTNDVVKRVGDSYEYRIKPKANSGIVVHKTVP
jgi:hypothetical protein